MEHKLRAEVKDGFPEPAWAFEACVFFDGAPVADGMGVIFADEETGIIRFWLMDDPEVEKIRSENPLDPRLGEDLIHEKRGEVRIELRDNAANWARTDYERSRAGLEPFHYQPQEKERPCQSNQKSPN